MAVGVWQWSDVGTKHAQLTIGQQIIYDRFSVFFMLLISVATVLSALVSDSYLRPRASTAWRRTSSCSSPARAPCSWRLPAA